MSIGTQEQYQSAPWMKVAESYLGVKEIRGGENPVILKFYAEAGHAEIDEDEVAWCSAFANAMMYESGINGTKSLMAKSWLKWSGGVKTLTPKFGDIVVFNRGNNPALGHVAFFISWDDDYVTVIGGNQGAVGEVSVARLRRSAVAGFIHPHAVVEPIAQPTMPKMTMKDDPFITPDTVVKGSGAAAIVSSAMAANVTLGIIVLVGILGVCAYLYWKSKK
jgi:uncharacterized protein (TIGR02594 family)